MSQLFTMKRWLHFVHVEIATDCTLVWKVKSRQRPTLHVSVLMVT